MCGVGGLVVGGSVRINKNKWKVDVTECMVPACLCVDGAVLFAESDIINLTEFAIDRAEK